MNARKNLLWLFGFLAAFLAVAAVGQNHTVTLEVVPTLPDQQAVKNMSKTVAWLVPTEQGFAPAGSADKHFRMSQKDKRFEPDLLVVPAGSFVDFPNLDPWFHNVFSLYQGKRFDLGLYEAGTQRSVRFERPGVSYLFCNIHPEMSAAILAVESHWYGTSNGRGQITIRDIPEGRYLLHVWRENAEAAALKGLERTVEISGDRSLGRLTLAVQPESHAHKNKYGKDYDSDALKPEY